MPWFPFESLTYVYNAATANFMFEKISSVTFEGSAISHNYYGYFSHVLKYKIEPEFGAWRIHVISIFFAMQHISSMLFHICLVFIF